MKRLVAVLFLAVPAISVRAADAPAVTIDLGPRQATGTPLRSGFTHTGGGNADVQQPSPDTVVITMTGVAVAGGHPCKHSVAELTFDLLQEFEVTFAGKDVKRAKLTLEARVIGLLRSHDKGGGSAEETGGAAAVVCGPTALLSVCVPGHTVCGGENRSVNDRVGPLSVSVGPGKYALHQTFRVAAAHPRSLVPCKAASAEFAPDPALDPLWISAFEPFHGAIKKDFGFQVVLRVTPE
jgi:hypothetical protein